VENIFGCILTMCYSIRHIPQALAIEIKFQIFMFFNFTISYSFYKTIW